MTKHPSCDPNCPVEKVWGTNPFHTSSMQIRVRQKHPRRQNRLINAKVNSHRSRTHLELRWITSNSKLLLSTSDLRHTFTADHSVIDLINRTLKGSSITLRKTSTAQFGVPCLMIPTAQTELTHGRNHLAPSCSATAASLARHCHHTCVLLRIEIIPTTSCSILWLNTTLAMD